MASKGKDQVKKVPKKKNGYQMPKPLKTGDILNDTQKNQWKIGVSIGLGGFGEIYSACKIGSSVKKIEDYPYVVKIVSCRQKSNIFDLTMFKMILGTKREWTSIC